MRRTWTIIGVGDVSGSCRWYLAASFQSGRLENFKLLDPASRTATGDQYLEFISWREVIWFKSISIFYGGLMCLSVVIGVFGAWLGPEIGAAK